MKIGLVGYQGSGKSTFFEWLTGIAPDPSLAHSSQSAMATIPDQRVDPLCKIYSPKKVTLASLELVDTPGLDRKHEGNAQRLAVIREAGCLVLVAGSFVGSDPIADASSFREDLLLADLEIVTGRCDRLRESVKKPRPNREQEQAELAAIEPLVDHLEAGRPVNEIELNEEQEKAIRSFCLLTQKPCVVVVNLGDDEDGSQYEAASTAETPILALPISLELELSKMEADEQDQFRQEMGVKGYDRDGLIRKLMDASGQMLFFTAGDKEVRTWLIHQGGTALEAADGIHSDLARGFIRAETISCDDLVRLGSEREVKAANLMRQEPKDYVIQDGDIVNIRFSV